MNPIFLANLQTRFEKTKYLSI